MTLLEWLHRPLYRDKPMTALQRLAELICVNGGRMRVSGWGCISGAGIYGRTGLEQEEALELIYLAGVVDGFLLMTDGREANDFNEAVGEEINRVVELQIQPAHGNGPATELRTGDV